MLKRELVRNQGPKTSKSRREGGSRREERPKELVGFSTCGASEIGVSRAVLRMI